MKKIIAYINSIIICSNDVFLTFKRENIVQAVDLLNAMSEKAGASNAVIDRFAMVYRAYRENKITVNSNTFVSCLYAFASFIVNSVLKKIYNVSCNETIAAYRRQHDLATLDDLRYCVENATVTKYRKKSGAPYTEIIDKDLYNGIKDNIQNFDEKQLMIENIVSYILEYCGNMSLTEIRFCKVNGAGVEKNFCTRLGNYKYPSRKVYITDFAGLTEYGFDKNHGVDSIKMQVDRINFIQLLFLKARQYIYNNDAIVSLEKGYVYLDKTVTDDDGNIIECYERQFRYSPFTYKPIITEKECKIDGDKIHIDGAKTDYELFMELVEKLKLTDIQKKVLMYRLKYNGEYGAKAIATATNLSLNTVKSALKQIRKKAVDLGIIPATIDYITDENTPINTDIQLTENTVDRLQYAVEKVQYIAPKTENVNRLDFSTDKDFETIDIGVKMNPSTVNRVYTAFDVMTDAEILLYGAYIIENRTDSKKPICDYWFKNHCEYSIKTIK